MSTNEWTVEAGRSICRGGKPMFSLHLNKSATEGYAMPPDELDAIARNLPGMLNALAGLNPEAVPVLVEAVLKQPCRYCESNEDPTAKPCAVCAALAAVRGAK
jgi:hypothetical protein